MLLIVLALHSAVYDEAASVVDTIDTPSPEEPRIISSSSDAIQATTGEQIDPFIDEHDQPYFDGHGESYFDGQDEPYFDRPDELYSDEQTEPPETYHRPESLFETASTAAVILETRENNNLVPLLLHFAGVLGPTWPITLYTTLLTAEKFAASIVLSRMEHQIEIRVLPEGTDISNHDSISAFLTKAWFWESLAPASHVLMFQSDSIICSNSEVDINDFLQYDFVGAPIAAGSGRGFNGGLSLRNREKMLEVIRDHDWQKEHTDAHEGDDAYNDRYEDQWFVERLKALPNSRIPSEDEAKSFAVETVWSDQTLGFHQLHRWQPSRVEEVEKWCPELKLTIGGAFA